MLNTTKYSFTDFCTYNITFDWEDSLVPVSTNAPTPRDFGRPTLQIKVVGLDHDRKLLMATLMSQRKLLEPLERDLNHYYCSHDGPRLGIYQFFGSFSEYVTRGRGHFCVFVQTLADLSKKAYRAQVVDVNETLGQALLFLVDKGRLIQVKQDDCWTVFRQLAEYTPCSIALRLEGSSRWPSTIASLHGEVEVLDKYSDFPRAYNCSLTNTVINAQLKEVFQIPDEALTNPLLNLGPLQPSNTSKSTSRVLSRLESSSASNIRTTSAKFRHKREAGPPPIPTSTIIPQHLLVPKAWDPSDAKCNISSISFAFANQVENLRGPPRSQDGQGSFNEEEMDM